MPGSSAAQDQLIQETRARRARQPTSADRRCRPVGSAPEASRHLVGSPVFKTGGRRAASSAGSIPVRLRYGTRQPATALASPDPAGQRGAGDRSGWHRRDPGPAGTGSARAGTAAATGGTRPGSGRTDHGAGTRAPSRTDRAPCRTDRSGTSPVRLGAAPDTATAPGNPGSGPAGTGAVGAGRWPGGGRGGVVGRGGGVGGLRGGLGPLGSAGRGAGGGGPRPRHS